MKNLLFLFVLCFYGIVPVFSQSIVYKGLLRDKSSDENLAYVNIGVLNKDIGTVSDTNGAFELVLDDKNELEILKISMVGYKNVTYKVADFKKLLTENNVIFLEKNIAELKEIVIKNKNLQTGVLGNTLHKKTVSAGFVNNVLGNEIGIIIKIKNSPTFIEAFTAMVDYNNYAVLKFRINFYDLKQNLPNNSILQENIIVTSTVKKGQLSIDLSKYNIMVTNDFFVSIELIEGLGEGGLHFLADYSGTPIITRAASQGKWNKQKEISFGFNVTAKY